MRYDGKCWLQVLSGNRCIEEYESKYFPKIRYDVKLLRHTDFPFQRIDSSSCQLLHKLAKNASIVEKGLECVPCKSCKQLMHTLDRCLKTAVSSPTKMKMQQLSSHCPLKYMSPSSQKRRKENTQRERAKDRSWLQKYSHTNWPWMMSSWQAVQVNGCQGKRGDWSHNAWSR